jgi:nitrate reductase gamma subunit
VTAIGFLILVYRRITVRRVAVTTSWLDLAVFGLLTVSIGLGVFETLATSPSDHARRIPQSRCLLSMRERRPASRMIDNPTAIR